MSETIQTRLESDGCAEWNVNILMVYEDSETGLRAKRSLLGLQALGLAASSMRTRLWRRELLSAELLRQQAAREAVASDVIIISLHGDQPVPQEVAQWLDCWLERKAERPYALGVLLDKASTSPAGSHPLVAHFRKVAERGRAEFLEGFCETAPMENISLWEASQGSTSTPKAYRCWGINE
jgi:hypothetical protein